MSDLLPSAAAATQPEFPAWFAAGHRYHPQSWFLRRKFGGPVRKLTLDAGLGCPHAATGGCAFCCPESFSPARRASWRPLGDQLRLGLDRLSRRGDSPRVLAYLQPGTNTHGPVETLARAYAEATADPRVVGLIVGTRPDCLEPPVLELLQTVAARTWLLVELGMQTLHPGNLLWLDRGHTAADFLAAAAMLRACGLRWGAHVILGLPGEGPDAAQATATAVGTLRPHSVKLHNLYVARDTVLAVRYAAGAVPLPGLEEYAGLVVEFLEHLPAECVVDRLSADAPAEYLVAPTWCRDKAAVRAAVLRGLVTRETWQGNRAG